MYTIFWVTISRQISFLSRFQENDVSSYNFQINSKQRFFYVKKIEKCFQETLVTNHKTLIVIYHFTILSRSCGLKLAIAALAFSASSGDILKPICSLIATMLSGDMFCIIEDIIYSFHHEGYIYITI